MRNEITVGNGYGVRLAQGGLEKSFFLAIMLQIICFATVRIPAWIGVNDIVLGDWQNATIFEVQHHDLGGSALLLSIR